MVTIPHWVYFTAHTDAETVHLVTFERAVTEDNPKTLCGQRTDEMTEGDETVSCFAATCATCLRRAGRK